MSAKPERLIKNPNIGPMENYPAHLPVLPRGAQLREGMIININKILKYRVTKLLPRGRVMMKEV